MKSWGSVYTKFSHQENSLWLFISYLFMLYFFWEHLQAMVYMKAHVSHDFVGVNTSDTGVRLWP